MLPMISYHESRWNLYFNRNRRRGETRPIAIPRTRGDRDRLHPPECAPSRRSFFYFWRSITLIKFYRFAIRFDLENRS
ncbi:hypothetical protein [Oxynema aestuarii]|uniref:Uncharacterized protein n=1 Tax=Oxynema aestuarii AP17 TaxID=2064643 RepID=A0A6H1TZD0_9CYAN|nr:hypothetical protein [Oxynema aestuarii]QIZ71765.1 hypothetical protein HCG48_15185 [Oxynema aestuarii AP17]